MGIVLNTNGNDVISANGYNQAYLKNAIINGNFQVNQRAKSGTVTLTSGQYGHDRWKAGSSGCTYTFATVENVTTITISSGSLIQVIEGINLETDTYVLSWNGTAQGKIGAGSYGSSGVTGSVVGGTNLNIEFNTGTISKVRFNKGSVPIEWQTEAYADVLRQCQRYGYTPFGLETTSLYAHIGLGFAQNSTTSIIDIELPKNFRAIPTSISYSGNLALNWIDNAVTATSIAIESGRTSNKILSVVVGVAGGLTAYRPLFLMRFNTSTATFFVDCEL